MSIDLVEIALDRFTDWASFERLAAEIMRDEGYPDIRPLGGVHDFGQDAQADRFYDSTGKRMRVAFQFTLRSDVGTKIRQTITRLDEAGVVFQKLVIVTSARISAETQQTLKRQVLRDHGVELDIFERKTLTNRLVSCTRLRG